jgi:hypothetical protein
MESAIDRIELGIREKEPIIERIFIEAEFIHAKGATSGEH